MSDFGAVIVADLGFGDAGKGATIDYLARRGRPSTVVRFNGGAQAAHNVITPDGRHHTFSQFGSGSFVPGVRTHLSRFMLFDPLELAAETRQLARVGVTDALMRLSIDEDALLVTPFHKAVNRLKERARGEGEHGTCGMGIGETMIDSLAYPDPVRARHLRNYDDLRAALHAAQIRMQAAAADLPLNDLRGLLPEEVAILEDDEQCVQLADVMRACAVRLQIVGKEMLARFAERSDLLFEGAQGVLLDEWRGFHPHTTWSTTTFENAERLLAEIGYTRRIHKIGVLRAYHTRHGAGPLPTFDERFTSVCPELHNGEAGWQGAFRCGWFDLVLARYALSVAPADALAITHLDRHERVRFARVATAYEVEGKQLSRLPLGRYRDLAYQEMLTKRLTAAQPLYARAPRSGREFCNFLETELKLPVALASYGPTASERYAHPSFLAA